jgi:hypothetical protein
MKSNTYKDFALDIVNEVAGVGCAAGATSQANGVARLSDLSAAPDGGDAEDPNLPTRHPATLGCVSGGASSACELFGAKCVEGVEVAIGNR